MLSLWFCAMVQMASMDAVSAKLGGGGKGDNMYNV